MQQQHHTNLNTGINSFVTATPDYELSPVGIASFQEQAQKLAEYGRNGDIYVVHAAEGETVIPMQVLDANPQIKELLFNQMRDMGMNPKEYVVGDELNSINPDTGMPEFFFKSIFKSVKKVFKKIAPIIVPMLGNLILPGIGGILASAMYTKLNGGSWGDVMKGAALSYVGGALMQGAGGALSDTGSFVEGFTSGLQAPFQALTDLSGSLNQGVFGTAGAGNMPGASLYDQTLGRTYDPNALDYSSTGSVPTGTTDVFDATASDAAAAYSPEGLIKPVDFNAENLQADPNLYVYKGGGSGFDDKVITAPFVPKGPPPSEVSTSVAKPSFLEDTFGDTGKTVDKYMFGGGKTPQEIAEKAAGLENAYVAKMKGFGLKPTEVGLKAAAAKAEPGMLAKYGPIGALATVGAGVAGAFKTPGLTDEERADRERMYGPNVPYELDPDRYRIADLDPTKYRPAPSRPVATVSARDGGLAQTNKYPRRELLVEGPGTERSDDIPAMLSDGEFVLNAKSVRGADPTGGGDRYKGAQNLYEMMRGFEMRG